MAPGNLCCCRREPCRGIGYPLTKIAKCREFQSHCLRQSCLIARRALSPVETRYSQTERETLAIVCAVEHFHMFLFGHHHCNIFPSSGCREASVKRGRELMRVLSLAFDRQLLYGASVAKWLAHLPFTSEAAGSSDSNPVLM